MKIWDKFVIACRWQYRWRVFNNQVLRAYWLDLLGFCNSLVVGIVFFLFLFSLPVRFLGWLFEPLYSPLIKKNISDRAYKQMDDMLNKNRHD